MNKFSGWIAFLSDGNTVPETSPQVGERTPWQQLLQKCREDNISIKRLSLVYNGVQIMSLPQKQCDGFFQAREVRKAFFQSMGNESEIEAHFQGIGSVVGEFVYITWVKLGWKPGEVMYITTSVRPLESCKIHTTVE